MNFSEILDRAIEPFSPRAVLRRVASRNALSAMRDYDVAKNGRRNQGFSRATTSADREGQRAGGRASATAYELVRNNKYAAAIDMHLTAQLIGDGISGRAVHKVKKVQKAAQEALDAFMKSKVDGRQDAFGVQKLLTSGMIVGGETLLIWGPDETGPDGRCHAVEGALLDHLKNVDVAGLNRIVQGVEFSENGDRVAYWLFDRHPGDLMGFRGQSKRYSAANIDHVFDQRRAGQTRGISWLAHVAGTLRDVADTADAKLMKEKVAACLALVLTSPDGQDATTPWSDVDGPGGGGRGSESRPFETLRPGAVFRARAGETAHVVNPPQSGEGVLVMKQELMGVAATTVPYHILTGDPSQANYSSLRALTNPFHTRLDDIQQNILVPFICQAMADRRMRRLALETGDKRYLEVTWKWAMPLRRSNDPIKDFAGELMEIRAGVKSMVKSLTERGLNPEEHAEEIAGWLAVTDALSLAFDSDPRRINDAGALQITAGYLQSGGDKQGS